MIETFSAADFTPLIGQSVLFDQPDYQETFTISEVTLNKIPAPEGVRQAFVVIMDGSNPAMMIEQGQYLLNLPQLGRHELMIGCVGKTETGAFRYQMVFN